MKKQLEHKEAMKEKMKAHEHKPMAKLGKDKKATAHKMKGKK